MKQIVFFTTVWISLSIAIGGYTEEKSGFRKIFGGFGDKKTAQEEKTLTLKPIKKGQYSGKKDASTTKTTVAPKEKKPGPILGFFERLGKKDEADESQEIELPSEAALRANSAGATVPLDSTDDSVLEDIPTPAPTTALSQENPPISSTAPNTPNTPVAAVRTIAPQEGASTHSVPPATPWAIASPENPPELPSVEELSLILDSQETPSSQGSAGDPSSQAPVYIISDEVTPEGIVPGGQSSDQTPSEAEFELPAPPSVTPKEFGHAASRGEALPAAAPQLVSPQEWNLQPYYNFSPQRLGETFWTRDSSPQAEGTPQTTSAFEEAPLNVPYGSRVSTDLRDAPPKLKVSMAGPQNIIVGIPAEYQITMRNAGEETSSETCVRILVPSWMDAVRNVPTRGEVETRTENDAVEYLWALGDLAPSENASIVLHIVPKQSASADLRISWTNRSSTTQTPIVAQEPQLELGLVGEETLLKGRESEYSLHLTNSGECVVHDAEVRVAWGNGDARQEKTFPVDSLLPNEKKELSLVFTPEHSGDLFVSAEALLHEKKTAELQKRLQVLAPQIGISCSELPPQFAGVETELTLLLENSGNAPAEDLTLKTTLPTQARFVSSSVGASRDFSPLGTISWELGSLAVGETREVKIKLCPEGEGCLPIPFLVNYTGGTCDMTKELDVRAIARIQMDMIAPPIASSPGELVDLLLEILNNGSVPVRDAQIVMFFAEGVEPNTTNCSDAVMQSGAVVFPVQTLLPGEKRCLQVSAKASQSGNYVIRAELKSEACETHLIEQKTVLFR
ncbi:MAG: hypothetical protein Q4D38_09585 [Planctomycetia bacterium]|nr:hypothetical protein [Planctomycetia bacterium]